MKKYLLICGFVIFISGCATISSIERNYRNIDLSNGINSEEAKIIAKNQIIQTNFKDDYRIIAPKVYDTSEFDNEAIIEESFIVDIMSDSTLYSNGKFRYSDSWHVVFRPKFLNFLSTYYLFVIDKNSGQVQYAHEKNIMVDLVKIALWSMEEDVLQLQPAGIAVSYYSEKGYWPTKTKELQEYFEGKIAQQDANKEKSRINLKDFHLSQTKEGYLLIKKGNREETSVLLYEVRPSGDNKFIVCNKETEFQENYILRNINGEIKVYFNFQGKNGEFLGSLFSPESLDKIIEKKLPKS